MRTTLDLDDDRLVLARQFARQEGTSIGQVVSRLMRKALEPGEPPAMRNAVPLFRPIPGAAKPSLEPVNRLRDAR